MSYYSLKQALEVFKENLPETLLPFDLPQLADLCRQGHITLLFPYSLYIAKPCWHDEDDGRPMYAPDDTYKFNDYLTHDHLISLLDGYTDSLSIDDAIHAADGSETRLYKHRQRDPDRTDAFTVTIKNIKIAASEVQAYIASNQFDDLTTPDKIRIAELEQEVADAKATGSFSMGTLTVAQTEPKSDKAVIEQLRKQITQLTAENDKLKAIEVESTDRQPKNQDSKIVVYLAFILAQKLPKYRKTNLNINAQQVGEAITTMAQELGLDKDDMHGFKRPDARLRTLINDNKELLSSFENLIKDNEKN